MRFFLFLTRHWFGRTNHSNVTPLWGCCSFICQSLATVASDISKSHCLIFTILETISSFQLVDSHYWNLHCYQRHLKKIKKIKNKNCDIIKLAVPLKVTMINSLIGWFSQRSEWLSASICELMQVLVFTEGHWSVAVKMEWWKFQYIYEDCKCIHYWMDLFTYLFVKKFFFFFLTISNSAVSVFCLKNRQHIFQPVG